MNTYYEMYFEDYSTPIDWPADFKPNQPPRFVNILDDKVYGVSGQSLYFPNVGEPTSWDPLDEVLAGAGFIDLSHKLPGRQDLITSEVYQNQLAIFSRQNVSLWRVDPDPAGNALVQNLSNLGTTAPRSLVSYGDADLLFLDRSGIRSIRAREGSDLAAVDDVGTPVDDLVTDWMRRIGATQANQAIGLLEPKDGRYWLIMGSRIYVYTFFPAVRVSAWSTYRFQIGEWSGWIDDATVVGDTIVLRSGDVLYTYGLMGTREKIYDDAKVKVRLPFLDAEDPAAQKHWTGFDMAASGTWRVTARWTPTNAAQQEIICTAEGITYNEDVLGVAAKSSHLQLTLESQGRGYHRLNNLAVHFNKAETG